MRLLVISFPIDFSNLALIVQSIAEPFKAPLIKLMVISFDRSARLTVSPHSNE